MGQKPSHLDAKIGRTKLPLAWILKSTNTTHNPNPEQPIKFQYKTRRKIMNRDNSSEEVLNNLTNKNQINAADLNVMNLDNCHARTKPEPSLITKEKHKHRRKSSRLKNENSGTQFGYEIEDIDAFLTKATIEKPANIPVVLAFPTVLYQTRVGGYQAEIYLPLGMVVNAVFKNQHWLYVQTPHAEEGYVSYAACLPLGIIPPPEADLPAPCWENSTDVFPKPSGNLTDSEKISSKSDCSGRKCHSRRSRLVASTCSEKSVDKLYLRAARTKMKGTRRTLLVICHDYESENERPLFVKKGDVVSLMSTHLKGWFLVRKNDGAEGFIPASVAGHGFL